MPALGENFNTELCDFLYVICTSYEVSLFLSNWVNFEIHNNYVEIAKKTFFFEISKYRRWVYILYFIAQTLYSLLL